MVWLDFVLIGAFVILVPLSFKRGVVAESFDVITFIVSLALATRLYDPLGKAINSMLTAWNDKFCANFAFFLVLIPVAITLLTIGFNLDRVTREEERIPKEVSSWAGLLIGIAKTLMWMVLFTAWLNQSDVMLQKERPGFARSKVVQMVRGMNNIFAPVVFVLQPSDAARKFVDKGMKKNF